MQTAAEWSTRGTITAGTVTTANSFAGWIESNATTIGIAITLLSFVAMLIFNYLNYRINKDRDDRAKKTERLDQIADLKQKGLSDEDIKSSMKLAGIDYAE